MRKSFLPAMVMVVSLAAASGWCEGQVSPSQPMERIRMLRMGDVDEGLFNRIKAYVGRQYHVPVDVGEALPDASARVDEAGAILAQRVKPGDICLVALAAFAESVRQEFQVFPGQRVGVVNVPALRPPMALKGDIDELHARWVEKESIRVVGLLIGLPECPFPRCALKAHTSLGELALKARNLCPPCQEKATAALQELGVTPADEAAPAADPE